MNNCFHILFPFQESTRTKTNANDAAVEAPPATRSEGEYFSNAFFHAASDGFSRFYERSKKCEEGTCAPEWIPVRVPTSKTCANNPVMKNARR